MAHGRGHRCVKVTMAQGSPRHPAPRRGAPSSSSRQPAARRLPLLLLLLLLLAACTTGGPDDPERDDGQAQEDTQPEPPADPLFAPPVWEDTKYGLHMDLTYDTDPDRRRRTIGLAESVGAQVSRSSFMWHKLQPTPDAVDWSVPDSIVNELTERGVEPLFAAYGSPSWANGTGSGVEDAHLYVPEDGAAFDQWVSQYAHFMRAAAARYRGKVTKWEVWNEQNESFFWKPAPDLDRYVEFFQRVRGAILQGNPEAQIAPGGLAGLAATGDDGIRGADFLAQMLERGIRPAYVSIHPYTSDGQAPDDHRNRQNNFDDIELIHDVLVEAGHEVPIWVTEWGWRSDDVGLETQAEYVARSLEMIASDYPYVTVATYFVDYDRAEFSQGLFTAEFQPKPAADAFQSFVAQQAQ